MLAETVKSEFLLTYNPCVISGELSLNALSPIPAVGLLG